MPRESTARAAARQVHAPSASKTVEKGSQRRATASIAPDASHAFDLDFVRGLIEAIDQSSVDSIEITRPGGAEIRISKSPPPAPVLAGNSGAPVIALPHAPAMMPVGPAAVAEQHAAAAAAAAPVPKSNLAEVKSPMVGTFYRAPSPEAPPYVEIGSTVRKGQTLCILEAMKLMNELESEVDGVVREILADNADPVEYGQVLFRVEPA